MFDLDQAIAEWHRQMAAGGIKSRKVLDELEGHLHDHMGREVQSGADEQASFESAVQQIGPAEALKAEFKKIGMKTWNRPLAFTAWTLFVASFFMPACMEAWGWQCATGQNLFWDNAIHGDWPSINYEFLTLSNIIMLASPFLLFRIGLRLGSMKWFRALTLVAALLVWSFIVLLMVNADRHELKIGAYTWATSFILLHLCAYRRTSPKERYA